MEEEYHKIIDAGPFNFDLISLISQALKVALVLMQRLSEFLDGIFLHSYELLNARNF